MNQTLKLIGGVLAVTGAISVIGATGMAFMHYSIMGGFGC